MAHGVHVMLRRGRSGRASVANDVDGAELRAWIDRQAIADLIHRYSDATTRADWDQLEAVFAADAILEVTSPFDFRAEGATAIRTAMSAGSDRLDFLIHRVDSIVIDLQGPGNAQATSTIHELGRGKSFNPDGSGEDVWLDWLQFGVYYDDIANIDGDWKFTRRFCQPMYHVSDNAVPGDAIAPRGNLVRTRSFPPRT
jgi:SnoaL-like domain